MIVIHRARVPGETTNLEMITARVDTAVKVTKEGMITSRVDNAVIVTKKGMREKMSTVKRNGT